MLPGTLLYLARSRRLRRWMENSRASRKLTPRFIAGATIEDGVRAMERMARERISGTLDHLGENVTSLQEAAESRDAYLRALEEIERARLSATVSIKLTQLGLDFSEDACRENAFAVVARAAAAGTGVELDMESSAYTDRTLQIALQLHEKFAGRVRAVIQACLYRSEADIRMLAERGIPVRLCKGAYEEPASTAFPHRSGVDANYIRLMHFLFAEGTDPAIATHDEKILRLALHRIKEEAIPPDRFEFQMLYGIRRDLQRQLVNQGFRLRLYVPCGNAWFPYFMRRLAERPANVFFLLRNLLRK